VGVARAGDIGNVAVFGMKMSRNCCSVSIKGRPPYGGEDGGLRAVQHRHTANFLYIESRSVLAVYAARPFHRSLRVPDA
jgi:hypothetical protein